MNRIAVALAAVLVASQAHAVHKCVDAKTGQVTYSDAACPTSAKETNVTVNVSRPPPPAVQQQQGAVVPSAAAAPAAGQSVDQRMLVTLQRDRRIRELRYDIANVEGGIDQRNRLMNDELQALRAKKGYARNNLAGATWEQSISSEMTAVTQKYKALNDVDFERLKVLRAQLEAEQSGGGTAR